MKKGWNGGREHKLYSAFLVIMARMNEGELVKNVSGEQGSQGWWSHKHHLKWYICQYYNFIVKRGGVTADEHEEHVVSIIASLFKNCTVGNNAGKQRERLLGWYLLE